MKTKWRRAAELMWRTVLYGSFASMSTLGIIAYTPISEWLAKPLWAEDAPVHADLIVVFGAFSTVNGILNEPAMRRTHMGAKLYEAGFAPAVLFTGGNDGRPPGTATADYMARFAEELGVPRDAMIIDRKARSTRENAVEATEVCRQRGCERVLIVSDMAHLLRAKSCFDSLSVHAIASNQFMFYWESPSVRLHRFYAVLYEYAALVYYRWKGWI